MRTTQRTLYSMSAAIAALVALSCIGFAGRAEAMDLKLQGKIALVTGSTSNIGYGIAKALLAEGADVIINARSQESVDRATATLVQATGRRPSSFVGDMTKPEDVARLVAAFPHIDILVNNLGGVAAKPFAETTDKDWYDSFDLNVMSGVRLSRTYLPGMRARNWGRIIFISSESALQIPVESIHYGMTKAAQIAVARGLAESTARTGITVNSVLPGPTLDPTAPRALALPERMGKKTFAEAEAEYISTRRPTSLIQRFAHPDEVASLVAYIASPRSSATTGAALRVDGGVVKSAF
jgi:NAD(P)-dependent dehydrogenase (short-subunit alcohol dehydrogenase family)